MKEIIYKGKKVKVPFEDAHYGLDGEKDIELQNPLSKQKATSHKLQATSNLTPKMGYNRMNL